MIENNICKLLVINAHVVNMFQARLSLCFRAIGGTKRNILTSQGLTVHCSEAVWILNPWLVKTFDMRVYNYYLQLTLSI